MGGVRREEKTKKGKTCCDTFVRGFRDEEPRNTIKTTSKIIIYSAVSSAFATAAAISNSVCR